MPITLDDVAPELRPAFSKVPRLPLDKRWLRALVRLAGPLIPERVPAGVTVEAVSAFHGIRIYRPTVPRSSPNGGGALLWVHGGGYLIGHPRQNAALLGRIVAELGITVFAPRYPLAPEHPFPAALDTLAAAWHWVLGEAPARGIDPARIVVAGESAGGGLAAGLVQRLHDAGKAAGGGVQPVAQWLVFPMIDDRTAARRELDTGGHLLWDNPLNAAGWRAYLGAEPGTASLPDYAAPARRANLSGLPPTWIGVGSIDLFRDEDVAYAQRLEAAGVPVHFREVPGAPHGFNLAGTPLARAFEDDALAWLAGQLGLSPPSG